MKPCSEIIFDWEKRLVRFLSQWVSLQGANGPVYGALPKAQPTGWVVVVAVARPVAVGVGVGRFGAVRPAFFGPVGRFPKLGFRAPIRRAVGLPGFTPVRQFLFGRGSFRRQNRRAFFVRPKILLKLVDSVIPHVSIRQWVSQNAV